MSAAPARSPSRPGRRGPPRPERRVLSRVARLPGWLLLGMLLVALPVSPRGPGSVAWAHPGPLDEFGGHLDERTSGYHYHKPVWDLARRTKEFLNWTKPGQEGELIGEVTQVERPDAIWVKLAYRPAFTILSRSVSAQNRNDKELLFRVWFRYVSPERSALSEGSEYAAWFRKKVVFELDRKLTGKTVTVQFKIDPSSGRPYGMVLVGEENINVWMVLHGWSYPLLAEEKTPYDKAFGEAEQLARKEKAGLWARGG